MQYGICFSIPSVHHYYVLLLKSIIEIGEYLGTCQKAEVGKTVALRDY